MLCKGLTIPNFNPKKDNFFVMLHFTCTCIKYFTKSIQKTLHTSIVVLKGDNSNAFKNFILYHKRKMSLP